MMDIIGLSAASVKRRNVDFLAASDRKSHKTFSRNRSHRTGFNDLFSMWLTGNWRWFGVLLLARKGSCTVEEAFE